MLNSRNWKAATAILAIVSSLSALGCKRTNADPFPASGAVAGWEKSGATRTFAAKDLSEHIEDGAGDFIEAGVVTASTSDYKYQGQLDATVEVFTMSDEAGAGEVFANDAAKSAQLVALGDAGTANARSATFRKGTNVVRIIAHQSTPGTQAALLALAHGVDAKL